MGQRASASFSSFHFLLPEIARNRSAASTVEGERGGWEAGGVNGRCKRGDASQPGPWMWTFLDIVVVSRMRVVSVRSTKARSPPSKVRCFATHLRVRLLHHRVPVRVGVLYRMSSIVARTFSRRVRTPTAFPKTDPASLYLSTTYGEGRDESSACCIKTVEGIDQR